MQRGFGRGVSLSSLIRQAEDNLSLLGRPLDSVERRSLAGKGRHSPPLSARQASPDRRSPPVSARQTSPDRLSSPSRRSDDDLSGGEDLHANRRVPAAWTPRNREVEPDDTRNRAEISKDAVQQMDAQAKALLRMSRTMQQLENRVNQMESVPSAPNVLTANVKKIGARVTALEAAAGEELKSGPPAFNVNSADLKKLSNRIMALEVALGGELKSSPRPSNVSNAELKKVSNRLMALEAIVGNELKTQDLEVRHEERIRVLESHCRHRIDEIGDNLTNSIQSALEDQLRGYDKQLDGFHRLDEFDDRLTSIEGLVTGPTKLETDLAKMRKKIGALEVSARTVQEEWGSAEQHRQQQEIFGRKTAEQVENVSRALQQRLGDLHKQLEKELLQQQSDVEQTVKTLLKVQGQQEAPWREDIVNLENWVRTNVEVWENKMAQKEDKVNQLLETKKLRLQNLERKVETLQKEQGDVTYAVGEQIDARWTEQKAHLRDLEHSIGMIVASHAEDHDQDSLKQQLKEQKSEYTSGLGTLDERLELLEVQGVDRETFMKAMEDRLDRLTKELLAKLKSASELNSDMRDRVARLENASLSKDACVAKLQADVVRAEAKATSADAKAGAAELLAKSMLAEEERRDHGPLSPHLSVSDTAYDVDPPVVRERHHSISGIPGGPFSRQPSEPTDSANQSEPSKLTSAFAGRVASGFESENGIKYINPEIPVGLDRRLPEPAPVEAREQTAVTPGSAHVSAPSVSSAFGKETEQLYSTTTHSRGAAAVHDQKANLPSSSAPASGLEKVSKPEESGDRALTPTLPLGSLDTNSRQAAPMDGMELLDELIGGLTDPSDVSEPSDAGVEWELVKASRTSSAEREEREEPNSQIEIVQAFSAAEKAEVISAAEKAEVISAAEKAEVSKAAEKAEVISAAENTGFNSPTASSGVSEVDVDALLAGLSEPNRHREAKAERTSDSGEDSDSEDGEDSAEETARTGIPSTRQDLPKASGYKPTIPAKAKPKPSNQQTNPAGPSSGVSSASQQEGIRAELKVLVTEFASAATSGIPCALFHGIDGAARLKTRITLFVDQEGRCAKLVPQNNPERFREMSLSTVSVFDYQRLKEIRPEHKILKVLTPEEQKVSVLLATQEETICILVEDQAMSIKVVKGLQVLSVRAKELAKSDEKSQSSQE